MTPFKIVVRGKPIVKKNTMKTTWFRWQVIGGVRKKVPLDYPIKYYTDAYINWAKKAVERLLITRQEGVNHYPIQERVAVTILFFLDVDGKVDLTNLSEGIMDVITGSSGLKFSKKSKLTHDDYKLLEDDSQKYVKFNSQFALYNKQNPRIEIFISPYKMSILGEVLNNIHPGLQLSLDMDEEPTFEDLFPNGFMESKKWTIT